MRKQSILYFIVFALLLTSFWYFKKGYSELIRYTELTNKSNSVYNAYQNLHKQILNAAVITPGLVKDNDPAHSNNPFYTDSITIIRHLGYLKATIQDSTNVKIAGEIDRRVKSELPWLLTSNVPDSLLQNKALNHQHQLIGIDSLLELGLARTKFVLDHRKKVANRALTKVLLCMSIFIAIAVAFIIYALISLSRQTLKAEHSEKRLDESERKFKQALDNMMEGIQIIDYDWKYTYVNDALLGYSQYSREEMIGHTMMERYPGIEQTAVFKALQHCMQNRVSSHLETEFYFPNGTRGDFELSIQPVTEGILILSVDVTERRKAELALQQNIKELTDYKVALDESSIVAITDQKGKIKYVNDNFCKISKYSAGELVGQDHRIINSGYHSKEFIRNLWGTIAHGKVWKGELKNKAKDGTIYWVDTTIVPFLNEAGKPYQYLAIRTDITERKKAEDEINKANRLYAFISAVNQSIVHTKNEKDLLDNVCKVATDIGRFVVTWIGMLDARKRLEIVSAGGNGAVVAELEKYSGTDFTNPVMQGTTVGRVLTTGEYAITNNIQNDTGLTAFKEQFALHGIKANMALPIKKGGELVGAICFNSATEGFFDKTEVELLVEAAGDISFALEVFEKERLHKEAEELVIISESRLKKAQSIAHIGHWELDFATGIAEWSEEACRIYGVDPAENKQSYTNWLSYIHPDDKERVLAAIEEQQQGFTSNALNYRIIRKDGTVRYIHSESKFEFDPSGKTVALYGIVHDITGQRLAEEKIRLSETKLKEAQSIAKMGNFDMDMATGALYWSEGMFSIIGYKHNEIKPSNEVFFSMIHPEDMQKSEENYAYAIKEFRGASASFRFIRRDGKIIYLFCEWQFEFDHNQIPVRMYGIIQDITESKLAENEIMRLNDRFQAVNQQLSTMLNTLPANIALLDGEGVIISINESWIKFAKDNGLAHGNYGLHCNYIDICENVTGADAQTAMQMANGIKGILNGSLNQFSLEYACHSPVEKRWFAAEVRPLSQKGLHGVVVMHINITDRKLAEEVILEMNNKLEQRVADRTADLVEANKQLESFSYTVSHDLRNPLQVINGCAAILGLKYKDVLNDDARAILSRIQWNTKHMSNIMDDLLSFSKLGSATVSKQVFDMQELVGVVIGELKAGNPQFAAQISIGALSPAYGDKRLMHQVIINLLSNAFKYSAKVQSPVIEIGMYEEVDCNVYFIRDNGAGFDMQYYDKLFSVFQRLHKTSDFEGTGVGLALVRSIITKHGGKVWAEGKVNEGATFWFSLPKENLN